MSAFMNAPLGTARSCDLNTQNITLTAVIWIPQQFKTVYMQDFLEKEKLTELCFLDYKNCEFHPALFT